MPCLPIPQPSGMGGTPYPWYSLRLSLVPPGRRSPSACRTRSGSTPSRWRPPSYNPLRRTLHFPSSDWVTLLPAVLCRRLPQSSYLPAVLRLSPCCLPQPFPLPMTPSDRPLCPPPHWIWRMTVSLPVLGLSICVMVLRINLLPEVLSGVSPNTCGVGGGPWSPRHIPPGSQGTIPVQIFCTLCAGPGRLRGGPPPSWP